jgi:hypothetical protein
LRSSVWERLLEKVAPSAACVATVGAGHRDRLQHALMEALGYLSLPQFEGHHARQVLKLLFDCKHPRGRTPIMG